MWENRCKVAVSGVGVSKLSRTPDTPLIALTYEAVKKAVDDAGLKMSDIDGLVTYPEARGSARAINKDGISFVSVNAMMGMLKLPNLQWHCQTDAANIGAAVQQGVNALLAGACKYVVAWRAMHKPAGTYPAFAGTYARGNQQFSAPYGIGGGAGTGMSIAYARYLKVYNQKREKMATLSVTQRKHANLNPEAWFYKTPLTVEQYLTSRMIAYPQCLYDEDFPVQGACAIVMTTAERARDLKPKPAYLAAYGQRTVYERGGSLGGEHMGSGPEMAYIEAGRSSSNRTWEWSGFGPKDVDVAQVYDGFTFRAIMSLESYGFCQPGEGLDFIQDGRIGMDGELPLNTFGGNLSAGRLHGLWHIIEGALQAQGRAGEHQVKHAEVSFVGASAGHFTTFIFVDKPY